VLVAAVMAQQTQMSRVLPKYDEFLAAFPTVEALARALASRVLRLWAPLGYNMRALRLHRAAKRIARDGGFPRTAAQLERIEGIGPFTAAVVSSFAFAEPVPAIDTNVRRVIARLAGDIDGTISDKSIADAADRLLARRAPGRWNQAMMDLGAAVCTARAPRCDACPLARWCRARRTLQSRSKDRPQPVTLRHKRGKRKQPPFRGSTRFYRGRIVQALRELPAGASIAPAALLSRLPDRDGLDRAALRTLVEGLRRDGLLRIERRGRVRLP
jgi:A/G-specific adenine glycosylase